MKQAIAKNFKFKKAEIGVFATKESDLALKSFKKDCRIMGLTKGMFSLIDLIHATLQKTGAAHVVTTTWSAGIKDMNQVKWMHDTNLIQSFQLITDRSFTTRKGQYIASIEELFGIENIRTSDIHAKFTLIHNEDYKVTIRTSMNLNANRTCENFEIDEDEDIFNFYMSFVENTFGNMPKGFIESSKKVNEVLDLFFRTKTKKWYEI